MLEIQHFLACFLCGLYNSVDTVDFGIQVLVFRVVFGLSEAVSGRPITLTHGSLALIVGACGDRVESGNEQIAAQ